MSVPTWAIWGSCVTRDLFEHPEMKLFGGPRAYVARTTIETSIERPVQVTLPDVTGFDQVRAVQELRKEGFHLLARARPDFLIVDLIDERHRRFTYLGSRHAYSTGMRRLAMDKLLPLRVSNQRAEALDPATASATQRALPEFCERLIRAAGDAQIVIHRALFAEVTTDGTPVGDGGSRVMNEWLSGLYDQLATEFDGIEIGREVNPIADPAHRWGLAPFHYDGKYEGQMVNEILALAK